LLVLEKESERERERERERGRNLIRDLGERERSGELRLVRVRELGLGDKV
jgi:hypothetical protein